MRSFKKLVAGFIAILSLLIINPTTAKAEWRQSGDSWWYNQGKSYATGWNQIDGQWYLFDSNGYMKTGWQYDGGNWYYLYGEGIMAHDCYIGSYYLGSNGAWTTSIPKVTSSTSSSSIGTYNTNNKSKTVYVTDTGKKYHSIPKCGNTKHSRATTLEKAQSLGLGACSKCF